MSEDLRQHIELSSPQGTTPGRDAVTVDINLGDAKGTRPTTAPRARAGSDSDNHAGPAPTAVSKLSYALRVHGMSEEISGRSAPISPPVVPNRTPESTSEVIVDHHGLGFLTGIKSIKGQASPFPTAYTGTAAQSVRSGNAGAVSYGDRTEIMKGILTPARRADNFASALTILARFPGALWRSDISLPLHEVSEAMEHEDPWRQKLAYGATAGEGLIHLTGHTIGNLLRLPTIPLRNWYYLSADLIRNTDRQTSPTKKDAEKIKAFCGHKPAAYKFLGFLMGAAYFYAGLYPTKQSLELAAIVVEESFRLVGNLVGASSMRTGKHSAQKLVQALTSLMKLAPATVGLGIPAYFNGPIGKFISHIEQTVDNPHAARAAAAAAIHAEGLYAHLVEFLTYLTAQKIKGSSMLRLFNEWLTRAPQPAAAAAAAAPRAARARPQPPLPEVNPIDGSPLEPQPSLPDMEDGLFPEETIGESAAPAADTEEGLSGDPQVYTAAEAVELPLEPWAVEATSSMHAAPASPASADHRMEEGLATDQDTPAPAWSKAPAAEHSATGPASLHAHRTAPAGRDTEVRALGAAAALADTVTGCSIQ